MKKRTGIFLGIALLILLGGGFVVNSIIGEAEPPSAPIEAIPLALNTPVVEATPQELAIPTEVAAVPTATDLPTNTPLPEPTATDVPIPTDEPTEIPTEAPTETAVSTNTAIPPTAESTAVVAVAASTTVPTVIPPTATIVPPTATWIPPTATFLPPTATPWPTATATPWPTKTPWPSPTATVVPPTNTPPPSAFKVYTIDQTQSTAQFSLGETLRGEPFEVVGTTNQVAAQIGFDINNPQAAQVGTVLINARTFMTDDPLRDNSIRNLILNTDDYEFITFVPTSLNGLPGSVAQGQTVNFQIVGNLTIKDVTQPVTFQASVTPLTANSIGGTATTTISRAAFGIFVPEGSYVVDVDDAVTLSIQFVANG